MIEIQVNLGDRSYPVRIGPWRDWDLRSLARGWSRSPWVLIADRRAWDVWSRDVLSCFGSEQIDVLVAELDGGEPAKSHDALFRIYDHLVQHNVHRDGTLAVFGGGVLGDLAGFAAATWQRGIRFVQIPTTLLAQVDSSVGGKTGLNYGRTKNVIGTFYQPAAVLISPEWLNSLPPREFRAGIAEVIKCAVIRDPELLRILEDEEPDRLARSLVLEEILARALVVKARIVEQDERDHGLRNILNFGHTIGHALEAASGFTQLLHGEAVSLGMVAALHLSVDAAGLPPADLLRIERLLARHGLPIRVDGIDPASARERLKVDKKVRSDAQVWVLTERLGTATVTTRVPADQVDAAVSYIFERGS